MTVEDASKLKELRWQLGRISQRELANALGYSLGYIACIEISRKPLTTHIKNRIADVYKIKI